MPLGQISKAQLNEAQNILNNIKKLLKSNTNDSSDDDTSNSDSEPENNSSDDDTSNSDSEPENDSSNDDTSNSDSKPENNSEIINLSSQFYTYIPYSCGRKKPPVIDNEETLGNLIELLDELKNLEVAINVTKVGQDNIDKIYKSLDADITPLDNGSEIWKIISDYVMNTHASTHNFKVELVDIYELNRTLEDPNVQKTIKKIGNRHLLWHGSRMTNFCSIIKNGLILNPESLGVYITGKMFGGGVYTANSFSKSFNYCDSDTSNNYAALLLCDVALGTPSKRTNADYYITKEKLLKEKCHSTWDWVNRDLFHQ